MHKPLYLDYNATTPLDPGVREAMLPFLGDAAFGNPSSIHHFGRETRAAVDDARDLVARTLRARPAEIIFTGGGTESDNLALLGLARAHASRGRHIITSRIEHHAVLHACQYLENHCGFSVTYLNPSPTGRIDPAQLAAALRPETVLVSIMSANNETGVLQPVAEMAGICRAKGVLFHTDAIQSFGKQPVFPHDWGVDALSLAPHKFYGPKGTGILFLKFGLTLEPIHYGGYHEGDRRPGTENVAGIVGAAAAVALAAKADLETFQKRSFDLTEKLWTGLKNLPGIRRNGDPEKRLGNTLNVSFEGLDGEELLMSMDLEGLCVSSGSACMVGSVQPSHVLMAMGVPEHVAKATIRFSIGKSTTPEAIDHIITVTRSVVGRLAKTGR
ncbi:MAG: cysteine desulfurase family protein [Verrucomicrobiae bacterium]|nr:cysteine desulfurase family protein [Verrucomicrobiae bacterium]